MDRRAIIAVLAALTALGLAIGLRDGERADPSTSDLVASAFPSVGETPGTPLPAECLGLPPAVDAPAWAPASLPLPAGSYISEVLPPEGETRRLAYTAAGDLDAIVAFLLEEWPARGWTLGRGEREPGEAETTFFDDETLGQMIARSVYCDDERTLVILVLAPRSG